MKTGDNVRMRADGRFEARYKKGRSDDGKLIYGYAYGKTKDEAIEKRNQAIGEQSVPPDGVRRMNLLILGAGGQGRVLKDVADSLGVFGKIAFLDDDETKSQVLGDAKDCAKFIGEYPIAIPSIGDTKIRKNWINMLAKAGFVIPSLVSPSATVSPSAKIGYGVLIEPKVIIGSNANIGNGCIVSSGAIIERDAFVEEYTNIDCGETVRKPEK